VSSVTVAIPVRDGGEQLQATLSALAGQTVEHELLVCDSGSRDGSVQVARDAGARVLEIPAERFGHGSTRNLLMQHATGSRVAFLTQDSEPADARWLEHLLGGLDLAPDVSLAFGPYLPRPAAGLAVRLELEAWFASLSESGRPQIERLGEQERVSLRAGALAGRRGFFSDANACVLRGAWQQVPFRDVPYAEDRVLALEMLRAGYAKAFVPQAAVIHSHAYTPGQQLRRSFDEWRGLLEVYGWREPIGAGHLLARLRGALGAARAELSSEQLAPSAYAAALTGVATHQLASLCGALLGSRADRLPDGVRRRLSLERRRGFSPLALEKSVGGRGTGRS
jgi:rhamnosyltransferase